jgi:hypothetical protein
MLKCTDEAGWSAFVYASDPGLMLIVEGLYAVGADDDILALAHLEIHVAALCCSTAVVAREGICA